MFNAVVIGCGFMGVTHTQALRQLNIPVVGVLGADIAETSRFAEKLGIPRIFNSLDELLSDPQAQVAHLCTPNHLHYPHAKALLQAGKHLMIEKPLANNSAQGAELIDLAKKYDRAVAVNYSIRYYPLNQEARARIHSGQIGLPRLLHAEYCQDWLFLPTDWNWRLIPEEGGELRVVGDIGTHVMDMLTWLTGLEITEVCADSATFLPVRQRPTRAVETFASKLSLASETEPVKIRTEDAAMLLLRFSNGARGVVTLSQVNAGRKNAFWWEVNGSSGSLQWHQETPNQLWLGYREKPNEVMIKDPALMQPEVRAFANFPGGHAEGYPDTFYNHFAQFYTYLAQGDFDQPKPFPTLEDGRRELVLCEAIQTSIQQGRWVKVTY